MRFVRERASVALAALALFVPVAGSAQRVSPVRDPHRHVLPVHQLPWTTELASDARFDRVRDHVSGRDTVRSPNKQWRAFVAESAAESGGRVRIESVSSEETYELRDLPLPYRPISHMVWITDRYLAFDRWSQPHYGVHYVVDVVARKLVLAAAFPDSTARESVRPPEMER